MISQLRFLMDSNPEPMWMFDQKTLRFLEVNAAAVRKYGYTRAQFLKLDATALRPQEEIARFKKQVAAMRGSKVKRFSGLKHRTKTGKIVEVDVDSHVVEFKGRKAVLSVIHDLTRHRQIEAKLLKRIDAEHERTLSLERVARAQAEAANRAKDEFLAVLSHELRTPMTAVLGWTWLLRAGDVAPEEQSKALEIIERNMKLQAQIIEDLLDVSSIITGKIALEPRPVRIDSILQAAIESLSASAQARKIAVEAALEPLVVKADAQRLQQVFWNLVSNAVKFNKDSGRVRVSSRKDGACAVVSIEDTGEGLSPEFLAAAFDPFRQQESSLTRKHRGLGLGLAIVRHLIELHGGGVSATSRGPGKGATFTIVLPLTAERVKDPGAVAPAGGGKPKSTLPHTLDGVKILLVDDEPDTLQMLGELLRFCGGDVDTAISAADALEAIERRVPDVLVSDIAMPLEDGYSLLRRARQLKTARDLRALALTAHAKDEDRRMALEAGFQLYLAKPVDPRRLVAAIRSLAGLPELA